MNTRHLPLRLLCAATLAALAGTPVLARAGSTTATPAQHETERLGSEFAIFAGSDSNAQALVQGLRDGTPVTLDGAAGSSATTTFTPATGKLGYGNARIALSLAEASLAKAGITDPTPAEIAASLNGGTLVLADGTSIDLKGVLTERTAGEGWGKIANGMGLKLGDVTRSPKAVAAAAAAHAHAHAKVDRVELARAHGANRARPAHPEHIAKVDRPDRPSRPERPEHPDHPDHVGRPGG